MWQRQEKLRPLRVSELRPLLAERLRRQTRLIDDRLVLVGIDRADRVDDRSPRPDVIGRGAQQAALQLRKRLAPPTKIRPASEHAETRAGGVHEHAVVAAELGRQLERIRADDRDVGSAEPGGVRHQLPRPARVLLDRSHVAGQLGRLAAGSRTEIENALALPRADDDAGELRSAALRPDPALGEGLLVDSIDPVGAGDVGRFALELAPDQPDDRLRRLVLRPHQGECLLPPEIACPDLLDPVGIRVFEPALRQRLEQRRDPVRDAPEDRVREGDGALQARRPNELDGFVDGRVTRRLHEAELVRAEPERRPHGSVQLADRSPPQLLDRMVERASALDRPVGEPLGERSVSLVEARGGRSQRAVGICTLLEDAQHRLVRRPPGRRDHQRSPRRNSS